MFRTIILSLIYLISFQAHYVSFYFSCYTFHLSDFHLVLFMTRYTTAFILDLISPQTKALTFEDFNQYYMYYGFLNYRNCLQALSSGYLRTYFICFPYSRNHIPILPFVQCLKRINVQIFVYFSRLLQLEGISCRS